MSYNLISFANPAQVTSLSATGTTRLIGNTPLGGIVHLTNFPNLTSIHMPNNALQDVRDITNKVNLTYINFSNEGLNTRIGLTKGIEFFNIFGKPNLRYFNTACNKLSGSVASIGILTNLNEYIVSTNFLSGAVPELAGSGLRNVQLSYNSISALPANWSNLLEKFYCISTGLSGNLNSITQLANIKEFNVSNNSVTGSIPQLSGISFLLNNFNASNNKITGLIPNFNGLFFLSQVSLNNNSLTGTIPPMSILPKLCSIDLSSQLNFGLSGLIPNLNGVNSLQFFNVSANSLSGFTYSLLPSTFTTFIATNNVFTLTATWYCLSAFKDMADKYNVNGGKIFINGDNMPGYSVITGPINTSILNLSTSLGSRIPRWDIRLGNTFYVTQ